MTSNLLSYSQGLGEQSGAIANLNANNVSKLTDAYNLNLSEIASKASTEEAEGKEIETAGEGLLGFGIGAKAIYGKYKKYRAERAEQKSEFKGEAEETGQEDESLIDRLTNQVENVADRVEGGIRNVIGQAQDQVENVVGDVQEQVRGVVGDVQEQVRGAVGNIQEQAENLINNATEQVSNVAEQAQTLVGDATQQVSNIAEQAQTLVGDATQQVSNIANQAQTQANNLMGNVDNLTDNVMENYVGGGGDTTDATTQFLASGSDPVKSLTDNLMENYVPEEGIDMETIMNRGTTMSDMGGDSGLQLQDFSNVPTTEPTEITGDFPVNTGTLDFPSLPEEATDLPEEATDFQGTIADLPEIDPIGDTIGTLLGRAVIPKFPYSDRGNPYYDVNRQIDEREGMGAEDRDAPEADIEPDRGEFYEALRDDDFDSMRRILGQEQQPEETSTFEDTMANIDLPDIEPEQPEQPQELEDFPEAPDEGRVGDLEDFPEAPDDGAVGDDPMDAYTEQVEGIGDITTDTQMGVPSISGLAGEDIAEETTEEVAGGLLDLIPVIGPFLGTALQVAGLATAVGTTIGGIVKTANAGDAQTQAEQQAYTQFETAKSELPSIAGRYAVPNESNVANLLARN
jgi:uncharacterized protein YjbJ (UPF0337 family)